MRLVVSFLVSVAFAQAAELQQAARSCDVDRLRQLLSKRPALDELDESGATPLHAAVESRQMACVRLLVEAGADRGVRDGQGRTAADIARKITDQRSRADILLCLVGNSCQGMGQKPSGPMPWSLEHTVNHRQDNVTKMLLDLGANPNAPGAGGTTPLADAALKGNLDAVRALLAHGARADTVSPAGTQPIHDAALGGSAEVIRELVSRGADVNARTRDEGQTPLHMAASMGRMKAVEVLVTLGADRQSKDKQGRTPLVAAERAGMMEAVELLKRAPAAK